ncbi:MAG: BCCT family transporter, partial [Pseudomonadales bacterium]|nr:BCCT family transporter [Pseudomonadales bacterium]
MLVYGSLGCALFYMILGNFGLNLELTDTISVSSILAGSGQPAAIVAILEYLPFAGIMIGLFALIALIFSATTYDSASYV